MPGAAWRRRMGAAYPLLGPIGGGDHDQMRKRHSQITRQEHVESAFKEDAAKRIREVIGARAVIEEGEPVSSRLKDVTPDMVLRAKGRNPVAVFLANSPQRVNDAIFFQMAALYEVKQPIYVVALLERETSVSRDLRQRAANRLTTVPVYIGDEEAAIQRIEREVVGTEQTLTRVKCRGRDDADAGMLPRRLDRLEPNP